MLFNSTDYLLFLPIVFIIYWALNKSYKNQNILLLLASYVFYGWWDWRFLSLIIFSSFVDYFIGLKIDANTENRIRKRWLIVSLCSNLGLLAVFKYFNFFTESFAEAMSMLGWQVNALTLDIILPVGISFYTFQTLSYTIDIYRKNLKPTTHIISFFTYVSFFPQLVAGPIERASNLLPQIESVRTFKWHWFKAGIFQIFIGLLRKIAIADNLGLYVDSIYAYPEIHNTSTIILATVFYAFQIYFDFSGYSDIAIGSAKLMGFKFNRNFDLPYFSNSITVFWRKWHISLSSWLRDYLYISLGGNRKGIKITYRNLMLTMLLGGLWHGSSWNFVIWGAIHGLALSGEKFIFARKKNKYFGAIGYVYTFLVVLFAWIFFRAENIKDALMACRQIVSLDFGMPFMGNISIMVHGVLMLFVGLCFDSYLFKKKIPLEEIGEQFNTTKLAISISVIILILCAFYSTSENFIYFQF